MPCDWKNTPKLTKPPLSRLPGKGPGKSIKTSGKDGMSSKAHSTTAAFQSKCQSSQHRFLSCTPPFFFLLLARLCFTAKIKY